STNTCSPVCASGTTLNTGTGKCNVCSSNQTLDFVHESSSATPCAACSRGGTYNSTNGTCSGSRSNLSWNSPTVSNQSTPVSAKNSAVNPTTGTATSGSPLFPFVIKQACSTGHLYNYNDPANPVDVGPATLPTDPTNPNANNTAGILDYPAIPGAYSVLSGVK